MISLPVLPDADELDAAVAEITALILARYPAAKFHVYWGDDPTGLHIQPAVDIDDFDEVLNVVIERLLQLQIDDGLPIWVLPTRYPYWEQSVAD